MRRLSACAIAAACTLATAEAHADPVFLPVRLGGGYSWLFDSPVSSVSVHGVLYVPGDNWFKIGILGGFDSLAATDLGPPERDTSHRGLFTTDGGLAALFAQEKGVALEAAVTAGPLFFSHADTGFGLSARLELYPWHRTLTEVLDCNNVLSCGLASGLSLWALGREDWFLGRDGSTVAGGIGIDLARAEIAPLLHALF